MLCRCEAERRKRPRAVRGRFPVGKKQSINICMEQAIGRCTFPEHISV